jgi:hypothetical protein
MVSPGTMLRPTKGMGHPLSAAVARHRCALGERATAAPRGWLRPDPMIEFAELDALNSEVSVTEDCTNFVSHSGGSPQFIPETWVTQWGLLRGAGQLPSEQLPSFPLGWQTLRGAHNLVAPSCRCAHDLAVFYLRQGTFRSDRCPFIT